MTGTVKTMTQHAWTLFDFDGCLVDSSRAVPETVNVALDAVGASRRDPAALQWVIGPPLRASFAQLLGGERAQPELVQQAVDAYRAAYATIAKRLTAVQPGIAAMLAALSQRRAIVTSKPADAAVPLADHVGLLAEFEELFGPVRDVPPEPKQETLRRALDVLEIADPSTAVMIGDRHHDIDAGRAIGCPTIGVTWGAGEAAELVDAGADGVVDDPAELPALVARLVGG